MQTFQDTVTLQVWAYDPDIVVSQIGGVYSFKTAGGVPLNAPTTLQPYVVPPPPGPTLAQQATAALSAPLTITSPTLGLVAVPFAIDDMTQSHINSEINAILLNSAFADGTASVSWPDAATPSVNHTWTIAQFKVFASTVGSRVATLYKCINGTLGTLPSNSVVIV